MRRKEEEGAPAHVGLFAGLMTIMLAFFILITSMASQKDPDSAAGELDEVQGAFGMRGGFGVMQYSRILHGGSRLTPSDDSEQEDGDGEDRLRQGAGGDGNTDSQYDSYKRGHYVSVRVPHKFKAGSFSVPNELASYLQVTGTGFAMFDYVLNVRCYAGDTGKPTQDHELAAKRAAAVVRYLHQGCAIPYSRMRAAGYASRRYFPRAVDEEEDETQALYLSIFVRPDAGI